jgi:hypothetical protein
MRCGMAFFAILALRTKQEKYTKFEVRSVDSEACFALNIGGVLFLDNVCDCSKSSRYTVLYPLGIMFYTL